MASSRNRQRQLARAKLNRQIARRTAQARRRRQLRAGVAVTLSVALVVLGGIWLAGGFDPSKPSAKPKATGDCTWTPRDTTANENLKDVGTPPTSGMPLSGTETMTITTNHGPIQVELDAGRAPCAAASFAYLAGKKFFDNTSCHRLTTKTSYLLQCGDPTGTGAGGPAYTYADEGLPAQPPSPSPGAKATTPAQYPAGSVAVVNSGPNTNGSQFFIVYQDTNFADPSYGIVGRVTKGLDIVRQIAAAGAVDTKGVKTDDGKPKTTVVIESLTVAAPKASASPSA